MKIDRSLGRIYTLYTYINLLYRIGSSSNAVNFCEHFCEHFKFRDMRLFKGGFFLREERKKLIEPEFLASDVPQVKVSSNFRCQSSS